MLERLRSPWGSRTLLWASGLVLLAGVIAFTTVRLGAMNESLPEATPPTNDIDGTDYTPSQRPKPKLTQVPKAARDAAGEFILAAVGREDLPKAWRLTHPDLRAQCACSYKEWLTGNIPVQPFPVQGLRQVSYAVDTVQPRQIVLEVLLVPQPGTEADDLGPQAFYLGLKARDRGEKRAWLVDYWAPSIAPPVPLDPGSPG